MRESALDICRSDDFGQGLAARFPPTESEKRDGYQQPAAENRRLIEDEFKLRNLG
jgi:hypothetical protein